MTSSEQEWVGIVSDGFYSILCSSTQFLHKNEKQNKTLAKFEFMVK